MVEYIKVKQEHEGRFAMTGEWHELSAGALPRLRVEKLEPFGFKSDNNSYAYEEELLDGDFRMLVRVSSNGAVSTLLIDTDSNESYVLHLVENAQGSFVGDVRAAYQDVLNRIGEACGEHGAFCGAYIEEVLRYAKDAYGDEIEYPWKDLDAAVIRSHVTKKWYALFMKIHPSKIGLGGSQPIRVMNLHGTAEQVANLVDGEKYFPGYHMNRKYWYTVCLDGSVPMDELRGRINDSFELSQPKVRKVDMNKV